MSKVKLPLDIQQSILNYIRSQLEIDTGNLRFNGTTLTGSTYEFEINVGGIMADYFKYLDSAKNFDKTAEEVKNLLDLMLNGEDFSNDFSALSKVLSNQEFKMDNARRNEVFFRSLERNS